ncbi:MAG: class I SAM-dependent methyltransferase [Ginsengibacter sp.]
MDIKRDYGRPPDEVRVVMGKEINIFDTAGINIDEKVVNDFGEEWLKFNEFTEKDIKKTGDEYFDLLNGKIVNQQTYAIDIGCGTGRWSKYLSDRAGFIEAVDPSDAIFAAAKTLNGVENVRLTRASVETLPFKDETFDFAMSVGVLHHIPDTMKALTDCVKKLKTGGYFYVYLYYNMDNRGSLFKALFHVSDAFRKAIAALPTFIKKFVCDVLAVCVYMPIILIVQFLLFVGFTKLALKLPLSAYHNKSFFIIRNDSLDRFGTRLEQRFSAKQVKEMMENAGLSEIVISPKTPYYHAIGKKVNY